MAKRITAHTKLLGVLTDSAAGMKSQAIYNEAVAKMELDYAYLVLEVEREKLEDAVKGLRAIKTRGFHVSLEYSSGVLPYLDLLSPAAYLCGAVDTVVNENGLLVGYMNIGASYFKRLPETKSHIEGKNVLIAGDGVIAAAVAAQAALYGAGKILLCPCEERACCQIREAVYRIRKDTLSRVELVGENERTDGQKDLWDQCLVVNVSCFSNAAKVVAEAEQAGCTILENQGIDSYQAAAAFKLWTGKEFPMDYINDLV